MSRRNDESSKNPDKKNLQDKIKEFYNTYTTKKTISNGLMDGAVLATNASQLRILLSDKTTSKDTLWIASVILVSVSIIAQLIMAVLLGFLARNTLTDQKQRTVNNLMNNTVLVLTAIVFVTNIITNVFIQVDITEVLNNKTKTTI